MELHCNPKCSLSVHVDYAQALNSDAGCLKIIDRFRSGSNDLTLKLWDISTGKLIRTFAGHAHSVNAVAISRDGSFALSLSNHESFKLWDISTGREIRTFTDDEDTVAVVSVVLTPDGRYALSGSDNGNLKLWDITSGRKIRTFTGHKKSVYSISITPDGRHAISGSDDNTLKMWDIAAGKEIRTFRGRENFTATRAVAPNGQHVLLGSADHTLKLWDIVAGTVIRTFTGHSQAITSLAITPDGRYALSGSRDKTLKLWDMTSGEMIRAVSADKGWVRSIAITPDGRYALSGSTYKAIWGSYDCDDKSLRLWDISTGREIRTFTGQTDTGLCGYDGAITPDGRYVLGWRDDIFKLWDISSGKELRTFKGHKDSVFSVVVTPDGRNAISGSLDKTLKLWELSTGKEIRTYKIHKDYIFSVVITPDGRTVLSKSTDNTLKLWDISTGKVIRNLTGRTDNIYYLPIVTPDGRHAIFVSHDGTTKLWDIATGKEMVQFVTFDDGEWVALTPEGYYNSSGNGDKHLNVRIGPMDVVGIDDYRSQYKRPDIVKYALAGQKSPPSLTIAEISLREPSGNNILDAEETGVVRVLVRNTGTGPGIGVNLTLSSSKGKLPKGLVVKEATQIGFIKPGEERTIDVEISATEEIPTAGIELKTQLAESGGFDSAPVVLAFNTGEFIPPKLEVAKVELMAADGRRVLAKGRETTVSFTVQNAGRGKAKNVSALLETNNQEVRLFSESRIALGDLSPGASKQATFNIAVTQRYSGAKTLPVAFSVKEERDKFSIRPDIAFVLGEEAPEIRVVKVTPKDTPKLEAALLDDISVIPFLNPKQTVFGQDDLAVVIGIEKYQNIPKSEFSYNDAKLMRGYLKALGFADRNIALITDEQATRSGIEKSVEHWLPNRVKKGSRVFIYYSGHGSPDPTTGEPYIVPQDADLNYLTTTGYPLKRLYAQLAKLDAKDVIVALDSCFSGAGGKGVLPKGAKPALPVIEDPLLAAQNIAVITSSEGIQISTSIPDKGYSLFTYYFLKAIKDGKGDLVDIYQYIKPLVEDEARSINVAQSPALRPGAETLKGRFALRR